MSDFDLIAVDMDGTLLNDKLEITKKNKDKLNELAKKDIYITLATARTFNSAFYYARKLGLDIPIITYNGALIKEIKNNKIIYSNSINLDLAKNIIILGKKNNIYTKIYVDEMLLVREDNEEAKKFSKNHRIKYEVMKDIENELSVSPYMIVFKDSIDNIKFIKKRLSEKFSKYISYTQSHPNSLEVMNKGVSKKTALKFLANKLNIDNSKILAIGNSENDFEMLKWSGLGIAMKNSDQSLLDKWNQISEYNNNESGVFYILNKYINVSSNSK